MSTIEDIITEAFEAAKAATDAYIAANPDQWYPCGFAWVNIRPARGPLVNALKVMKAGSRGYSGGLEIWNPSGHNTQCMDAKFAGAKAFADVLKSRGYQCTAQSRMD
jgi:hypothetical protein